MKMKKLGSLLTAVSMIASMAAYLPVTVSASYDVPTGAMPTPEAMTEADVALGSVPELGFTDYDGTGTGEHNVLAFDAIEEPSVTAEEVAEASTDATDKERTVASVTDNDTAAAFVTYLDALDTLTTKSVGYKGWDEAKDAAKAERDVTAVAAIESGIKTAYTTWLTDGKLKGEPAPLIDEASGIIETGVTEIPAAMVFDTTSDYESMAEAPDWDAILAELKYTDHNGAEQSASKPNGSYTSLDSDGKTDWAANATAYLAAYLEYQESAIGYAKYKAAKAAAANEFTAWTTAVEDYNAKMAVWNLAYTNTIYEAFTGAEPMSGDLSDGGTFTIDVDYLDESGAILTAEEIEDDPTAVAEISGTLTVNYGDERIPSAHGMIAQVTEAIDDEIDDITITDDFTKELVDNIIIKGTSKLGIRNVTTWYDWEDTPAAFSCIYTTPEYAGDDEADPVIEKSEVMTSLETVVEDARSDANFATHDYSKQPENDEAHHECKFCGDLQEHSYAASESNITVDSETVKGHVCTVEECGKETACQFALVENKHVCKFSKTGANAAQAASYATMHDPDWNFSNGSCNGNPDEDQVCDLLAAGTVSDYKKLIKVYPGSLGKEAKYSLEIKRTEAAAEKPSPLAFGDVEAILTVYPDASYASGYKIPAFQDKNGDDNEGLIYQIAYENSLNVDMLYEMIKEVKISGNLIALNNNNVTSLSKIALAPGKLKADCRVSKKAVSANAETGTVATENVVAKLKTVADNDANAATTAYVIDHKMVPVTQYKNHKCDNGCGYVDPNFAAHDFTLEGGATIRTSTKEHICACGKSDKDYMLTDKQVRLIETYGNNSDAEAAGEPAGAWTAANDAKIQWNSIHDFTGSSHSCKVCSADAAYSHTKESVKIDKDTHSTKCTVCGKALSSAEAHKYNLDGGDFAGMTPDGGNAHVQACQSCGNTHTSSDHVYKYGWKFVENEDGDIVSELVLVGETNGLVCACGAVKKHTSTGHVLHTELGHHYCYCGADVTSEHTFSMAYNENGVLVNVGNGVVCKECGAIKSEHYTDGAHVGSQDVETYYDKVNHKHMCKCGKEIEAATYGTAHNLSDLVVDKVNHNHYCDDCGYVSSAHNCDKVLVIPGLSTGDYTDMKKAILLSEPADPTSYNNLAYGSLAAGDSGCVCECGAITSSHQHDFKLGINPYHYCRCGVKEENPTHNYSGNNCSICGIVKSHTHKYGSNCICTETGCNEANHTFKIENGNHTCQKCGLSIGQEAADPNELGVYDNMNPVHKFTIVKDNKHVCACGLESTSSTKGHEFGTTGSARHECQVAGCSYNVHFSIGTYANADGIADPLAGKTGYGANPSAEHEGIIHYCPCGYEFAADKGHMFSTSNPGTAYSSTQKFSESNVAYDYCECGLLDPKHTTHAVYSFGSAADTCYCGAAIDHALVPVDNANHKCSNVLQTLTKDSDGYETVTVTSPDTPTACSQVASESHDAAALLAFTDPTAVSYCKCGYVNPNLLADVIVAHNGDSNSLGVSINGVGANMKKSLQAIVESGKYATVYVTELEKAAAALYPYNINLVEDGDPANLKTVKTASEKASFEALLETYTNLYEKMSDNQAAGGAIVEKSTDTVSTSGIVINASGQVNGQYGEKVNLSDGIKVNPGYKFAGWYSDKDCKTLVSSDISFEVTVGNGYKTYYAKATQKTTTYLFDLPGNIKYKGTITAKDEEDGKSLGNGGKVAFVEGEEVSIWLRENKSDGFLYLKDSTGTTHKIGTNKNNVNDVYKFKVTGPDSITYETFTAMDITESIYAVFKADDTPNARIYAALDAPIVGTYSGNKGTYDLKSVLDAANRSATPNKAGYKFEGWVPIDDQTKTYKAERLGTAEVVSTNPLSPKTQITLIPKFIANKYKINLEGGQFAISADETINNTDGFTAGTTVGLWAPATNSNGKYFSGWYVNGAQVAQTQAYYYVVAEEGVTVEAKYEGTEPISFKTKISMTHLRTLANTQNASGVTKQVVSLISNREVASGNTVVEVGFVYSSKGAVNANTTIDNVNGGTIKKASRAFDTRFGTYQLDITLGTTPTATVTARAYVIYTDANGVQHVEYSAVDTCTAADLK